MINALNENGSVDEEWRFYSTEAQVNDRVWLLKQGAGPRGIFGIGHFIGPRERGIASNKRPAPMALVRFTTLVDPKRKFLIGQDLTSKVLDIIIRSSGTLIDDTRAKALEQLLPKSR